MKKETMTYTGKFLGFTTLDGFKLKYFRLLTTAGEYIIKIPKEERLYFYKTLQLGDSICTTVTECYDPKKGLTKRKAITIDKIATASKQDDDRDKSIKILVCRECKGSSQLVRQLQNATTDKVTIKMTGCMKRCKQAPNLTILPLKRSFSEVKDISTIINLINQ